MSGKASLPRRLLAGWMAIASHFGEVQTLVLLSGVYVVVIGPTALVLALARRDLLGKRGLGQAGSAWTKADSATSDLERARRSF